MTDQSQIPAPEGQPSIVGDNVGGQESKQVAYETYLKTLDEAKKAKARLREFEAAEKARLDKELVERGEYQKLLTQRDDELKSVRDEIASIRRKEADRLKLASILNAAGGEIDSKWYGLIDYENVVINPDTGVVDEMSVARAVENLKKSYPEIIRTPNGPRLPVEAPQGGSAGKISRAEWLKLPGKEMTKWKPEQILD